MLKNNIQAVSPLANLLHEMIGKHWYPDIQIAEIESWFDEWHNENIPLALIALDGTKPIGMCSLQMNDGIRPDLKPWLGDYCVHPAYQKRGIGKRLIDAAKQKAKEQGFDKLYLFAPDPNIPAYYIHLGWRKIGMDAYHGHPVTVMELQL